MKYFLLKMFTSFRKEELNLFQFFGVNGEVVLQEVELNKKDKPTLPGGR